ncbi:MAG: alpha/beta fold hydrolase [Isosphaeraceae bacterium]
MSLFTGISAAILAATALARPSPAQDARAQVPLEFETPIDKMLDIQTKRIDDLLWYQKVGDLARIDKHQIASSKPLRVSNPTAPEAGNSLVLPVYTMVPRSLAKGSKAPSLIFVHGGLHASFDSDYAHIVRELLEDGYVIVAPEYRGSTGYGQGFHIQVDYGGAEVDDVHDARDWAIAELPEVDPSRVGILGWSHGGYIGLLNIFRFPDDYRACYAGVPVADLVQRMGYKSQYYRDQFEAFLGKAAKDDPKLYLERSPAHHAAKLKTPLLIHAATNDEDVHIMEVRHLVDSLKAAGKSFEHRIYENAPGGHRFNRIDTKLARESRAEMRAFLAKHLKK